MASNIIIETSVEVIEVGTLGPQGPAGQGVPAGGSALQVLRKVSSTDYDTEWATGGGGGSVDLSSPDPIGDVTPNTGAFTTLSATGTATLPHIHGSLAGNLYIHVKNVSGGELTRGTPVYIVGNVGDTDRVEVAAADFDDPTKMPAVGLLDQTLAQNGSGDAIILGELDEANTNAYAINTELFVGNNGALTSTRPTTGQVQSVGVVARVNSNTGVIVVNMQGQRSPNETFAAASHTHGNITNAGAIGTTSGLPVKTGTSGVIEAGAFGTAAGSFCEGNDSRLSDARTPSSHAASHHTGGADALTPANIGAAATAHTHAAADITSGTFDNARINFAAPPAIGNTTPAAGTFTTLTANNGTLTASAPVLDLAQTWNNAVVTFTALRVNVTNTNSASASLLADFQTGGLSMFSIGRFGGVSVGGNLTVASTVIVANAYLASSQLKFNNAGTIDWSSSSNKFGGEDLTLARDAADTLAQRRAANAQTFNIYNTFTSATNHERGFLKWSSNVFQIGTEKGSGSPGGTARALEFQTDSVTRMTLGSAGEIGFFGTAAAAQPAAIADATDAATTQARLNDLLAAMRTLGLIDT